MTTNSEGSAAEHTVWIANEQEQWSDKGSATAAMGRARVR
jgi:hypothetical protein